MDQGRGEMAISLSVFCYARITVDVVDVVDAVSDFKIVSFMSLGGRFKQILVLAYRPFNARIKTVS